MRSIKWLLMICIFFLAAGCEKTETFNNTPEKVGNSRVTFFPTFSMQGDRYVSVVKGETFNDPGVTAKEGSADLTVNISGAVNASQVGVYDLVYSATNKDGFSSSVTRTIAVLPSAEAEGVNIAGSYVYKANTAYQSTITKLAPGFYLTDNVWGASTIPSYIITVDGNNLVLPLNSLSGYGQVQGSGTLDAAGNLNYKVDLLNYGLLGVDRKWLKQ